MGQVSWRVHSYQHGGLRERLCQWASSWMDWSHLGVCSDLAWVIGLVTNSVVWRLRRLTMSSTTWPMRAWSISPRSQTLWRRPPLSLRLPSSVRLLPSCSPLLTPRDSTSAMLARLLATSLFPVPSSTLKFFLHSMRVQWFPWSSRMMRRTSWLLMTTASPPSWSISPLFPVTRSCLSLWFPQRSLVEPFFLRRIH